MDERQWVKEAARGDIRAFEALVHAHQGAVLASACQMLRNRADAEDLAQETFVEVFRSLHSLRDQGKFRAWLFTILRNKCLRHLRIQPNEVTLDEVADTLLAPSLPQDSLTDLLAQLPLGYREVLAARYLHELSYAEIAKALGTTEHAVRMRCTRARACLRSLAVQELEEANALRQAMAAVGIAPAFTARVMKEVSMMTQAHARSRLKPWKLVAAAAIVLTLAGGGMFLLCPNGSHPSETAILAAARIDAAEQQLPEATPKQLRATTYTQGKVIVPSGLASISGITVDGAGNVYVFDNKGHRVAKYAKDGSLIIQWGGKGHGHGQFNDRKNNYGGLAIGPDSNLYVVDQGNYRVQYFTPEGRYLGQWSTGLNIMDYTNPPTCIQFGPDNLAYCFSFFVPNAVQVFTPAGKLMRTWKIGDGHYNSYQLSFDPDGNLFIVSTNDSVLQKFTPTGQSLGEWPTHHALGVALDATGNIYLSQSNPQDGQAIQKMSADMRTVLATIPMEQAGQLAIGVDGTLYAVQRKEMKIYTFIPTP